MADISSWSPVDASNNASPPNGWPENMLPSAVNDCARGMMGAIRRNYDQLITGTFAFTNITASGTITAPTITASGTVSGFSVIATEDITGRDLIATRNVWASSGAVTAAQLTATGGISASGNITAGADVFASGYFCDGLVVINTGAISTPGGPATAPAFYNETGVAGIHLHSQVSRYYSLTHTFYTNAGGTTPAPLSASAFTVISDARLKEDIEPAPGGLPEVLRLSPVSFLRHGGREREVGFVAQDVQEALPQAVTSLDMNGQPTLAISAMPILAALVGAIKDISKRLDSLEAR